jgi:HEAT repeat protein
MLLAAAALALALSGCERMIREETTLDGLTTSQWIERLEDEEDVEARREAAQKLGELGADEADLTVAPLIKAVHDADPLVRLYAIEALGQIGPKARRAATAVGRAVNDKDKRVMKAAIRVFRQLEMSKPSALNGS